MNERVIKDKEEMGSIGIGAMIVFIALILVAAVASTIIIKTAEELQQNAEQTSSDTRQQISGKVAIVDILVASTADTLAGNGLDHVATMDIIWRVSSGSTGIYPADVSYYITCEHSASVGLGFDDGLLPASSLITETAIGATVELSAGNTYYTTVTLGLSDTDADDDVDGNDVNPGCDSTATQGETLSMRIVVDGGGETLTDWTVHSLTWGSSMM
jgi:flagellin FlaB